MEQTRRAFIQLAGAGALLAACGGVRAQALDKTVHMTVAYGAGGATDTIIRYVADKIRDKVGSPIIIENRPGADGNIAAEYVLRQSGDGYNLLVSGPSTHAANASIYKSLPYDPERDFTPLTTLATAPYFLVVNPQRVKAETLQAFIASARASKASLSFASANVGGRIAGERFRAMSGINAVNIPYRASTQAMTDLLGGQYDFYFCDAVTATPQLRAGKIRALAVSTATRVPAFPDVPTVEELGYPGFDVSSWIAIWAAATTPPAVSQRLAAWINGALDNPDGRRFLTDRALLPQPGSPEDLRAIQQRDTVEWGKVIVAAGMQQH
ncbi:ABC transporter substrate-binding protein [Achromobacter sp. RTa]|uniref:Bug family tripartite tricarboxylate transporter substrate binding protein n=1 Tax=Achromobacter sp. RTa TaxID=1532557 RepID=UPI00050F945C|nr:tripartite tricarboxylate transporter substrate binding protein [Achromobacter sp. RTa]KGD90582.1 ABC transporter substrate-binding protein [Achromobacter sp. RTa]